jgi:hypothetical protein
MNQINITAYLPYVFSVAGLAVITIAFFYTAKKNQLKETGIPVDGIIFRQDINNKYNQSYDSITPVNDKITVRFVTQKQEWITGEIKQDFQLFYTGQYKDGETIKVYYDPENPSDFYVDTKQSELISRVLIGLAGITLLLYGLYKIFI